MMELGLPAVLLEREIGLGAINSATLRTHAK